MARDTAAICDLCDQFQGFAMLPQLVRVEESAIATLIPSSVYQPLSDCTYGTLKRHFPNCVRHRDYEESHGQSMSQVLSNKHIDHHL
jgi:nucleotidyltransferase/DNA polymerase involved in DNA repair